MAGKLELLGSIHLSILAGVPAIAGLLAWWTRRRHDSAHHIRFGLGITLVGSETAWLAYEASQGGLRFPDGLPLQLCDLTLWMTVALLFTLKPSLFDYVYYWALTGTSMALLTPDLWEPMSSYASIQFFIKHGVVVISVLYLVWARVARPRPGSVWRAFLLLNVYAGAIFTFNWTYHTNYFYILRKPAQPSILNWFGPWPIYIFFGDALALAAFLLLWLPFKQSGTFPPRRPNNR